MLVYLTGQKGCFKSMYGIKIKEIVNITITAL